MPPKPKFTREEVIRAAYALVEEEGSAALTARELGCRLGSSARPIFTVFRNMEEVKAAVRDQAVSCFRTYMRVADDYRPAFKKRGMQFVKFAQDHPHLFSLLFMQRLGKSLDFDLALASIPFRGEEDIAIITRDYHATPAQAEHLFRQMWTYTYSLCVLSATGVCTFTDQEIAGRLGEIFCGMVYILHSGDPKEMAVLPVSLKDVPGADLQRP